MERRRETAKSIQEMKDIYNVSIAKIAEMTQIPYQDVYNLYRLKLNKINPGPTSEKY